MGILNKLLGWEDTKGEQRRDRRWRAKQKANKRKIPKAKHKKKKYWP